MCERCNNTRENPWPIPSLEELLPEMDGDQDRALDAIAELEAGLEIWREILHYNDSEQVPNLFPDGGGTRSAINHLLANFLLPVVISVLRENAGGKSVAVINEEMSEHLQAVLIEAFSMGYVYGQINGVALSESLIEKYRKTVRDTGNTQPASAADSGEIPEWKKKLNEFLQGGA